MIAFFAIQQFSGIFVVFIYASQFSLEAGVTMDEFLAAVVIGVIRCCTTALIAFASDKFGRKPLAISSGIGMFACMLGLTICTQFHLDHTNFFWLPTALLFGFVFSGSLGFLPLPFAMVAEMYPQKVRGLAVGMTLFTGFVMSFANIKTFSTVFEIFGSFVTFSFYTIIAFLGILFAAFILPETKGKSLQEIESHFRGKK
jgi:facilitated trehalose transporter